MSAVAKSSAHSYKNIAKRQVGTFVLRKKGTAIMTTIPNNSNDSLAVLFDADNANPAIIEGLLAEIAKLGIETKGQKVEKVDTHHSTTRYVRL